MTWKRTLAEAVFYLLFIALFVIFYVKDLLSDFIEGRSTMTSQIRPVEEIEFPTVTVCMKPGYKNSVLKRFDIQSPTDEWMKAAFPNQSLSEVFREVSYIEGRDFKLVTNEEHIIINCNRSIRCLGYTINPIFTQHHGTCYKLQPISSLTSTDMPHYLYVQIIVNNINREDKPKGVNVYLTSEKTWPNIAYERWPQITPTKFSSEFTEDGLVTGMKLKMTEHIFHDGNENIADCHRDLFLAKSNCTTKCNFLSYDSLPICNFTEDQICAFKARKKYDTEFENCFKIKHFLTYNPSIYETTFNPLLNSSTIEFYMSIRDLKKEVREEVKTITAKAFIGSLGGSVGMFFGFSFTATILYVTEKIKIACDHFFQG